MKKKIFILLIIALITASADSFSMEQDSPKDASSSNSQGSNRPLFYDFQPRNSKDQAESGDESDPSKKLPPKKKPAMSKQEYDAAQKKAKEIRDRKESQITSQILTISILSSASTPDNDN